MRELVARDYVSSVDPPATAELEAALANLDALGDNELLDLRALATAFGYPATLDAQDMSMTPRGYRMLARIPRLQFAHIDRLVRTFSSLQGLLAATADDLQAIEGIGSIWSRHVREGLSRLAESSLERF